jgi:hypothetical protein
MAGERGWRNLRLYSDLSGAYSRDYFDILADGSEVGAFNVFTRRDHPPLLVRRDYRLDRRPRPAHGAFPIQPRCGWCWTARRKGVAAIGIRSWTTTPDGGSYIAIRTACRRIRMTSAADFPTTTEFAHWASVSVALCMEADLGQCPRYGSNPVSRMTASVQVFGRRNGESMQALWRRRPKSAKARNRGELGTGGAAGAMGIWPRGEDRGGWSDAVEAVALPGRTSVRLGVNERRARCATGLAVRLRANLAGRRKRGRCRPRGGQNGECRCGGGSAVTAS